MAEETPIVISLTRDEADQLASLIDIAAKAQGIVVVHAVANILLKLQDAEKCSRAVQKPNILPLPDVRP